MHLYAFRVFVFKIKLTKRDTMKHDKDATTILGPAGVSNSIDASRPIQTAAQPIQVAIKAICSGEFEKALAVAAGMISKAVINKTPTIFIDTAITAAIRTMRIKLTRSGFSSSAIARSRLTVAANNGRQI